MLFFLLFPIFNQAGVFDFELTKQMMVSKLSKLNCADFSGKWEGACNFAGKTKAKNINISQFECTSWNLSDFPYFTYLNGEQVTTDTNLSASRYTIIQKVSTKIQNDQVEMVITNYNHYPSVEPSFKSEGIFRIENSHLFLNWNNSLDQSWSCQLEKVKSRK